MSSTARAEIDWLSLPEDPIARRETLELRAAPVESKPRISPEVEYELADVEEKTAQAYLQAEETTYRLFRLAKRINEGTIPRYMEKPSGD